jgi:hypothetical protein
MADDGYTARHQARLWKLLPAVYRTLDLPDGAGPLREIIDRIGGEFANLRRGIDRLYDNQSIETCDDWAIPYIGDLLATRLVSCLDARAQRVDVAKTIYYRRRSGTLGLLEELAADIAGRDARAVEFFRRLGRTRHQFDPAIGPVPTYRPGGAPGSAVIEGLAGATSGTPAGGFADLRNNYAANNSAGAFDEYAHSADLRRGGQSVGWHNISHLGVFVWWLYSFQARPTTPVSNGATPPCFSFDPTGRRIPLFARSNRINDGKISGFGEDWITPDEWSLPVPVRETLWDAYPDNLYPASFSVDLAGGSAPTPRPRAEVRIHPETGVFSFANPADTTAPVVEYHFGFSSRIGAGGFDERVLAVIDQPTISASVSNGGGLDAALAAIAGTETVELADSLTYPGIAAALMLPAPPPAPAPAVVVIRAQNQERPVIRWAGGGASWKITGQGGSLVLQGLWLQGADLVLAGTFDSVRLRLMTLDPGSEGIGGAFFDSAIDGTKLAPTTLWVEGVDPGTEPGALHHRSDPHARRRLRRAAVGERQHRPGHPDPRRHAGQARRSGNRRHQRRGRARTLHHSRPDRSASAQRDRMHPRRAGDRRGHAAWLRPVQRLCRRQRAACALSLGQGVAARPALPQPPLRRPRLCAPLSARRRGDPRSRIRRHDHRRCPERVRNGRLQERERPAAQARTRSEVRGICTPWPLSGVDRCRLTSRTFVMASDRARISYDPTRAYRGVIAQQGRVTLEADLNEESTIGRETLRLETIDIIGPAGTPDNGYKVTGALSVAKVTVGVGTYYLGGWRLTLDAPVALGQQPDWLDAPPLPDTKNALVALLVTEQSVSAVEDQALREVALGGPDTGARHRLIQQFPLIPVDGDTCETAAAILAKQLAAQGITIDPASCELLSDARLSVGFVPDPAPADPCTPAAAGGYLGADNQLIRVTVIAYDGKKNAGKLLWGRNNASFLYRATTASATPTLLTLQGAPIDQEHAPQLGQAVEILRSRVELKDGSFTPADIKDRNFVAADAGFVTTVAVAYDFDDGTLTLADALPAEYVNDPNPLFLRLWDAIVPFNDGVPKALDTSSGVTVTISMTALPTGFVARPFWRFAVRPDTPAQVYPVRYHEAPQPPDGARQWLGDLAVIGPAAARQIGVLADCRPTFDPLTKDRCGCCGLTLDPAGVDARGGLQAVVDSLAGGPAVLTLKPGNYVLQRPLLLTGDHKRLVIEGCGFSSTISADPKDSKAFVFGLVVIVKADAVTLRRLEFDVPMVEADREGGTFSGVMVADSGLVVIEDCNFTLHPPKGGKVAGPVFGGAITISGRAAELSVRRNRFVGKAIVPNGTVCGFLAAVNNKNVATALMGVDISDNFFDRLNAGIVAFARLGEVRCAANRMRECNTGIFLADPVTGSASAFAKHAVSQAELHPEMATLVQQSYPAHFMAAISPDTRVDPPGEPLVAAAPSRSARASLLKEMTTAGKTVFESIVSSRTAAAGAAAAEARAAATGAPVAGVAAAAAPAPAAPPPAAEPKATAATRAQAAKNNAQFLNDLAHLDAVAVNAQLAAQPVTAVLHVENNDITLVNTGADDKPGTGIAIVRAPGDDPSMVLMSGNRVICGDNRTLGGTLMFATMATVTGNMMIHRTDGDQRGLPVFVALGLDDGRYAYNGNVFHRDARILPARTSPLPNPKDFWPFLNTET